MRSFETVNSEFESRERRSRNCVTSELSLLSFQIERAASLLVDHAGVAEILAHQIGGFRKRTVRLSGERLLRIEAQQVLIAPRLVMKKAAQRMDKLSGRSQECGHFFIWLAKLAEPVRSNAGRAIHREFP